MKRYLSGLVPVDFLLVRRVFAGVGVIIILISFVGRATAWFSVSNEVLSVGLVMLIIAGYLRLFVRSD